MGEHFVHETDFEILFKSDIGFYRENYTGNLILVHLMSSLRVVEVYIHSPMNPHGVELH
jgi:hypothetical protein